MSKGNQWVPIDKYLSQEFKSINRPYSLIEAMFSFTLDVDKGHLWTVSGYSKQWQWSRNKVRRFVNCIRTARGHMKDSKRTHEGHPIHFINKGLWDKKDANGTEAGQKQDRRKDTTVNPNPNPNKKTDPLLNYLQEKTVLENLINIQEQIISFYKYRQAKPKAKRYNTEQGINGLFRNMIACGKSGLNIYDCLEIAMEEGWQTPKPEYYKPNNVFPIRNNQPPITKIKTNEEMNAK